jgi:hypothetical protein
MSDDLTPEAVERRKYLIRKSGSWYRHNSSGYTGSAIQAGRYTLAEAESITHPNGKDGPRDGMFFVHEDEVQCDDLKAYRALSARLAEVEADLQFMTDNRNKWQDSATQRWFRAEAAEAALATLTDLYDRVAFERDALSARLAEVEAERDAARETMMKAGIALHVAKREAAEAALAAMKGQTNDR